MATNLEKFLKKLDRKQQELILKILVDIKANHRKQYNYTTMKGMKNTYRIRKWSIRVVFQCEQHQNTIINVGFRKDVYE